MKFQKPAVVEDLPEDNVELPLYKIILFLTIGGVALWGGSELLIDGAVGLETKFNGSERVSGVKIVSVGTSISELAASVIAILKKEKAISLGNLIGSNIFNILAVVGITSIITPISLTDERLLTSDIYWMLAISFIVLPFVLMPKKYKLNWKHGCVFLIGYCVFIYLTL